MTLQEPHVRLGAFMTDIDAYVEQLERLSQAKQSHFVSWELATRFNHIRSAISKIVSDDVREHLPEPLVKRELPGKTAAGIYECATIQYVDLRVLSATLQKHATGYYHRIRPKDALDRLAEMEF